MPRTFIVHVIAIIVAPLLTGLGTGLALYFRIPDLFFGKIERFGISHILLPNVYELTVAYAVVLLLGLPGYLVLRKFNLARGYIVVLYAAFVGYSLSLFLFGFSRHWMDFVFPSLIVSAVAVLILRLGTKVPVR